MKKNQWFLWIFSMLLFSCSNDNNITKKQTQNSTENSKQNSDYYHEREDKREESPTIKKRLKLKTVEGIGYNLIISYTYLSDDNQTYEKYIWETISQDISNFFKKKKQEEVVLSFQRHNEIFETLNKKLGSKKIKIKDFIFLSEFKKKDEILVLPSEPGPVENVVYPQPKVGIKVILPPSQFCQNGTAYLNSKYGISQMFNPEGKVQKCVGV